MEFGIYVSGNLVFTISGVEAAWEAWKDAKTAAEFGGVYASLVDLRTAEVIADTDEE